jgi:hypothetical protein
MKKNIVYQSTANFLRFLDRKNSIKKSKEEKNDINTEKKEISLDFNYNTQELAY